MYGPIGPPAWAYGVGLVILAVVVLVIVLARRS